jgi:hypothetical protein
LGYQAIFPIEAYGGVAAGDIKAFSLAYFFKVPKLLGRRNEETMYPFMGF